MSASDYNPPVITETVKPTPEPTKQEPIVIKDVAPTVTLTSNQNHFREGVDNYFRYLTGKVGFKSDADRLTETKTFMQLVGIMLTYEYDEFEDCILYLIQALRNNPTSHDQGRYFRFMTGVESEYPIESITMYRILSTWLIRIATAWPTRVVQANKTDIQTLSKHMRKEAKENLNYFVGKMKNYGIK